MADAQSSWENIYPKQFQIEAIWKRKGEDFQKGKDYFYIPTEVRYEIENHVKTGFVYKFNVHHRIIEVSILHIGDAALKSAKWFSSAIQKIYIWLYIAGLYATSHCSRKMNVFIYWTDLKKKLPNVGGMIEQLHANTAFTTSCRDTTDLNIYRSEEWFKVFVHETFHNMGLDFSGYPQEDAVSHILKLFPVKSNVNLFETYCETWAETLNVCFLVFESTRNKSDIENMIKKMEKIMDYERIFSMFQCMKVLHFYGLDYHDLYKKTNTCHLARIHKYKESTNVLSYYILKSLLIYYIDDFLSWCQENNDEKKMNFGKSAVQENMMEYCLFIESRYLQKEYIDVLESIESWFDSKESNQTSLNEIRKTMRMTVFG